MNLQPAFKVFKEGTTTKGPITVLKGDAFNEDFKRAKYLMLGYTIIEINE